MSASTPTTSSPVAFSRSLGGTTGISVDDAVSGAGAAVLPPPVALRPVPALR